MRVLIGFAAWGLLMGAVSVALWGGSLDGPFAAPFLVNLPGDLLAFEAHAALVRARRLGQTARDVWPLGLPGLFMPASVLAWTALGVPMWAAARLARWSMAHYPALWDRSAP